MSLYISALDPLSHPPDADWKLLLIHHASSVGEMPWGGKVYCIEQIAVLPLTTDPSVEHVGLEVTLVAILLLVTLAEVDTNKSHSIVVRSRLFDLIDPLPL